MKSEKGTTLSEFLVIFVLVGIVAIFLLSLIPQQLVDKIYIPNMGEDYSELQTEWANLSNNVTATGDWDISSANVSLGEDKVFVPEANHADVRHKEAKSIREWMFQNCGNSEIKEFIGKGEKNGFRMFVCKMADGKHFAIYIVVDAIYSTISTQGKPYAEITCFLSRSWNYIQSVIDKGWYLPIQ